MVVVSSGAVVVANHRTTMTALNLAQASELLLNITHTTAARQSARLMAGSNLHSVTARCCRCSGPFLALNRPARSPGHRGRLLGQGGHYAAWAPVGVRRG